MSLQSFQRALVDLTLAPSVAQAWRLRDASLLTHYDLTHQERERLFDVARQPGLSVHCTLLPPLSQLRQPPANLPPGRHLAMVTLRAGRFDVTVLHPSELSVA